jgi:hypothetical protein
LSSVLLGWLQEEKIFRECSKNGFRRKTDFKNDSPERLTGKEYSEDLRVHGRALKTSKKLGSRCMDWIHHAQD